ncbi:MAG: hypothetical protein ACLSHU_02055 [Oscillospiraceae bacterium]
MEPMGCIQALTGQRYDTPMLTFCSASCLTVTGQPRNALDPGRGEARRAMRPWRWRTFTGPSG